MDTPASRPAARRLLRDLARLALPASLTVASLSALAGTALATFDPAGAASGNANDAQAAAVGSARGDLVSLELDDAAGTPLPGNRIAMGAAMPGMAGRRFGIVVRNGADQAAGLYVKTTHTVPVTGRDLDDVLLATVSDATGGVVYRGRLGSIDIGPTRLEAGATATYTLEVTWPESPYDNLYQSASLSFALTATETGLVSP